MTLLLLLPGPITIPDSEVVAVESVAVEVSVDTVTAIVPTDLGMAARTLADNFPCSVLVHMIAYSHSFVLFPPLFSHKKRTFDSSSKILKSS